MYIGSGRYREYSFPIQGAFDIYQYVSSFLLIANTVIDALIYLVSTNVFFYEKAPSKGLKKIHSISCKL